MFFGAKTSLVIFRRPVSHSVKNWNETVKQKKVAKESKRMSFAKLGRDIGSFFDNVNSVIKSNEVNGEKTYKLLLG